MKKFTKLFLSCTAVAALAVAMGTAAMAATVSGDVAGTYDESTGKLTISTSLSNTATILVLDKDADKNAVEEDDILYIDQTSNGTFGEMGLKGAATTALVDGKYPIMVGYYDDNEKFTILNGTLTIGAAATVLVGDVNVDSKINASDATLVVKHAAKVSVLTDETALTAADANEDTKINASDATCIVKYAAKLTSGTGIVGEYR